MTNLMHCLVYLCILGFIKSASLQENAPSVELDFLRNLQSCPSPNIDLSASVVNVIASVRLPNLFSNRVQVEVIYDIAVNRGRFGNFILGVFDEDFGRFRNVLEEELTSLDVQNLDVFDSSTVSNGANILFRDVCFDQSVFAPDEVSYRIVFEVDGGVCRHSSGRNALSASWISDITGDNPVETVGVDYTIPVGSGGFLPEATNYIISEQFTPGSGTFTVDDSSATELKLFVTYNPQDLNFNDIDASANVFLFLPENVFSGQQIEDCPIFEEGIDLFGLILVVVPAMACFCLISVAVGQRYYDRAEARRFAAMRRNNPTNLRMFPGNRDLVLLPGANDEDEGGNTVQAVLEEEDANELDVAVPTTTINVEIEEVA